MSEIVRQLDLLLVSPSRGVFILSLLGVITLGAYCLKRIDDSKPVRRPTVVVLAALGFACLASGIALLGQGSNSPATRQATVPQQEAGAEQGAVRPAPPDPDSDRPRRGPVARVGLTAWGGSYDERGVDCATANPATRGCSCPDGYRASDMSDAGIVMCFATGGAPPSPPYLFGGAYDPRGRDCAFPNPLAQACSCPSGFSNLKLSDADVHLCYAKAGAAIDRQLEIGGSYDEHGEVCAVGNVVNDGKCACPAGYRGLDLTDAGFVICVR